MQPATLPTLVMSKDAADFGIAKEAFARLGGDTATHELFDVVGDVIDDRIIGDLHTITRGERTRLGGGADIEGDDDAATRLGELDVCFGDLTDAGDQHADTHFLMAPA